MESAREVLRGEHLPRTQNLVTKSAAEFTTAELLYAYVLAGYLLETRPEETPEIVRRIGAGRPSAAVLEEVLAIGCGTLDERVRRWVLERPPG